MIVPTVLALLAQSATRQLPVAPPVPIPRSGSLDCELRDQAGATHSVNGVLSSSAPQRDGNRRTYQITFTSVDVPELAGVFEANWGSGGGSFLRVPLDARYIAELRLIGSIVGPAVGAVAAEVRSTDYPGYQRFYAGFCQTYFN